MHIIKHIIAAGTNGKSKIKLRFQMIATINTPVIRSVISNVKRFFFNATSESTKEFFKIFLKETSVDMIIKKV